MAKKKVIIMGAAGRDFHNFNVYFRDNKNYEVVAFTATQIPDIEGRPYPKELAGKLYPKGIPIYPEDKLSELIKKHDVDEVVLAYSDLPYRYVMRKAAVVNASGADFKLMGPKSTMLKSKVPVVSVCAVRTGCGKSETTRKVASILKGKGYRVVVIRHPMPYGILKEEICERFETYEDLDKFKCTIEEREEYEPHIEMGNIVYAGVDYAEILKKAEKEADVIIWDGGNNDFPFYKTNLHIVLADPLRPGHEMRYYPGEVNVRMADVVIVNKEKSAKKKNIETVKGNIKRLNPVAEILDADSEISIRGPELVKGKKALVVEDGPTLTHGGMGIGAGYIAAKNHNAKEIIDPRKYAVGSIKKVYEKFKQLGDILPAMGYGKEQVKELEKTINKADCDVVIGGTPINLSRILKVNKPIVRVRYELEIIGKPNLETILDDFERIVLKRVK